MSPRRWKPQASDIHAAFLKQAKAWKSDNLLRLHERRIATLKLKRFMSLQLVKDMRIISSRRWQTQASDIHAAFLKQNWQNSSSSIVVWQNSHDEKKIEKYWWIKFEKR